MGTHRAGQRTRRGHQRAGARLPLFRAVVRRSRRRRRRDVDVARRSLAAGAPLACRCACRQSDRAAGDRHRARRRSAADRGAGLRAVAAVRRRRSGRCGRHRRRRRASGDRQPRRAAVLRCRRNRRNRDGGSLLGARGKPRGRHRAALDRSHRRAFRSPRRDPRVAIGSRRHPRRHAADARHQAVADIGRLCRRPRLARRRSSRNASRAMPARRRR